MNQGCSQTFELGRFDGNHGKVKGSSATFRSEWATVAHILSKLNKFHRNHTNLEGRCTTLSSKSVTVAHALSKVERPSDNRTKRNGSLATLLQKTIVVAELPLNLAPFRCNHSNFKVLRVRWNLSKVKGSLATFPSEWAKVALTPSKLNQFHRNHTNLEVAVAHALSKVERPSGNRTKRNGSLATLRHKTIAVAESPLNLAPFRCNHSNFKEWAKVAPTPSKLNQFHRNHTNLEGYSGNRAKRNGSPATLRQKSIAVAESLLSLTSFRCNHSNLKDGQGCSHTVKALEVRRNRSNTNVFKTNQGWSQTLNLNWFDGNQGQVKGLPAALFENQSRLLTHLKVSLGSRQPLKIQGHQRRLQNAPGCFTATTKISRYSDSSRSTKRPVTHWVRLIRTFVQPKPKARPRSDMFSRDRMPTRMIFFQANQTRHSLGGLLELHEDHILPVLRRALGVQRGWIETIHGLLAPAFTFDDTGHLPTVEVKFEPGTPDYSGYIVKVDFVACSYCGMSNTLTITPAVVSIYERHLPSWESYGQRLCNDPDIQATRTLNLIAFLFLTTSIEKLNMPRAMTQTRAHVKIYGSKKLIQAIQPLSQGDYNNKVLKPLQRVITFHLSKHMDGRKTLGQQKEKFDLAMKGIMASFKQHLINHLINNEETLNEVSAFALSKFQDIRKPFIAEVQLGAAEEDRLWLKRKASDDGHQPFNKASRTSSPASTNNCQQAVRKQVVSAVITCPKGTNSSRKWTKRLPKTLDEVLKVGSGPGTDLWVFKAELEQKYGFDSNEALARMQKKKVKYLLDSLMEYKVASTQGCIATFSDCTFIVDAMFTQNLFRAD
ncbi:hypothetical protein C8J56DRAFT_886890 [Mycena floridula]|nr:hypothetical protein C8J56DRAFT_886890 [Mycena floridula]